MPHSVVSNFESALFASYPFGCLQTKMGSGIFSNYGMQMGWSMEAMFYAENEDLLWIW